MARGAAQRCEKAHGTDPTNPSSATRRNYRIHQGPILVGIEVIDQVSCAARGNLGIMEYLFPRWSIRLLELTLKWPAAPADSPPKSFLTYLSVCDDSFDTRDSYHMPPFGCALPGGWCRASEIPLLRMKNVVQVGQETATAEWPPSNSQEDGVSTLACV